MYFGILLEEIEAGLFIILSVFVILVAVLVNLGFSPFFPFKGNEELFN